jgi:hypothetical protein
MPILFPRIGYRYGIPIFAPCLIVRVFQYIMSVNPQQWRYFECFLHKADSPWLIILSESLIDTPSIPVDYAEAFSMFCSVFVFMLHSYRPLGRSLGMYLWACLLSRLRFHFPPIGDWYSMAIFTAAPILWAFRCSFSAMVPSLTSCRWRWFLFLCSFSFVHRQESGPPVRDW